MLDEAEAQRRTADFLAAIGWDYPPPDDRYEFDMETPRLFKISALTHEGTQELVQQINQYLNVKRQLQVQEQAQQPAAETDGIQTDMSVFKAA